MIDVRTSAVLAPPASQPPVVPRPWRHVLFAAAVYLTGALWVTARLWSDVHHRVLARNPVDHTLFEWMLAHGARLLVHGGSPWFTFQQNVPDGVNLAANTHSLGLAIPLAPVTLAFGPDVSFAVLLTAAFWLTALGWYHVFVRHLVRHRAALLGGLFCGFAPAMVAHGNGQPNVVAQFLVPYLVLFALRLDRRPVRNGVVLGLLAAYQAIINEEILFLAAVGLVPLVLAYALLRRDESARRARPYLAGAAVAAAVGALLLAYPLWIQFGGPQSYRGLPFRPDTYPADVLSYLTYPRQSPAGDEALANRLTASADEDNASFGVPLVLLAATLAALLWRRALVRAAVTAAAVAAALSLGPVIRINGHSTGIPGPYALVANVPPFEFAVPGRFAMIVVPVLGLLLALGAQRLGQLGTAGRALTWAAGAHRRPGAPPARRRLIRLLWAGALVLALVPLAPAPLATGYRPEVPRFFSAGTWRGYVPPGRTVVTVPLASYIVAEPAWWQASQLLAYPTPGGYFLGPAGPDDRTAIFGAPPRPTGTLLYQVSVATPGVRPAIGPLQRAQAVADLRYWRAAIVVLAPQSNVDTLRQVTTDLLGAQPRWVDGVWLWRAPDPTG